MLEMNKLEEQFKSYSSTELINYIFKRHHAFLKEELDRLELEIFTLYEVYHDDYNYLLENIYYLFSDLKTNFEVHMVKEEKVIFLHIKEYESNPSEELKNIIIKDIKNIEKNNNEIEYNIKEINRITNDFSIGTSNHTAFDNIYKKLKEIENETIMHFTLERNIIQDRMLNS